MLDAASGTVEQTKKCVYESKVLPQRTTASPDNFGSLLEFQEMAWQTGTYKYGKMQLWGHLNFEEAPQQMGLFPEKSFLSSRTHSGF